MLENRLRRRNPLVQTFFDNWFYLLILVFLWRFPYLVADWTDSEVVTANPRVTSESKFWQKEMADVFILAILAMSYNLMFGFTGLISFGHGAFFGAGVYVSTILIIKYGVSFEKGVAVALASGLIISLIWSLAAFRVKGVYFAMFTLAFAEMLLLTTRLTIFRGITGAEDGLTRTVPDWINPVRSNLQFYNITLACFLLSFLLVRRLVNSPTGKVLVAIRDNPIRTETLGFNIYLYRTVSIMVAGFLATLAGILHMVSVFQIETSSFGIQRTVDPLIMTLIGGTGTVPGPVAGAALLRIGRSFLRKPELDINLDFILFRITDTVNAEEYWAVALGVAFILFVLLIPYGTIGAVNKLWIQIRRWLRNYVYNPLIRSNPRLATWTMPFTGEPPELAIALAQKPTDPDFRGWIKAYPIVALNAITAIVALTLGLINWDWQTSVSWVLFLVLVTLPFRVFVLLLHRPARVYLLAILVAVGVWLRDESNVTQIGAGLILSVVLVLVLIPAHRLLENLRKQPILRDWVKA